MKRFSLLVFAHIIWLNVFSQNTVIPAPASYVKTEGIFSIGNEIQLITDQENLASVSRNFIESNRKYTGIICYIGSDNSERSKIFLTIDNQFSGKIESYHLSVKEKRVDIKANSANGVFYGLQSLLLMFVTAENNTIQCFEIDDTPDFEWRGLMLDESRCFFGKEKVKQILDYMAFLKLNKFHWHLTDVTGWRIEIKQYPKLTTVGAKGRMFDPEAPAMFYTQKEIREIIQYANDRFIEIIPEIDMPGHARAANMAYPEYSGGGSEKHPEFTFNPADEETFKYLSNILSEVGELFPSSYIHIGGDEVHFGNEQWNSLAQVKELMLENQLSSLKEVEEFFVRKVNTQLQKIDKTMIGWDEIVDSDVDNNHSVVMWWRHDKPEQLNLALNKGYRTVLCPRLPLYFDFDQFETHKYGRRWEGFCDLKSLYNYPDREHDLLNKFRGQIMGIQACIWTERIQNEKRLDYMLFPRIFALSEAGWTSEVNKSYESFENRLKTLLPFLEQTGIYYFNPFYPENTPEPYGRNP